MGLENLASKQIPQLRSSELKGANELTTDDLEFLEILRTPQWPLVRTFQSVLSSVAQNWNKVFESDPKVGYMLYIDTGFGDGMMLRELIAQEDPSNIQ